MTVRDITKTTLAVIILIIGFVFFRLYYVYLLSKFMHLIDAYRWYVPVILGRLFPESISAYFPWLFYCGLVILITACIIEAIFEKKTAFGVFSPFKLPLILTVIITAALCINKINILQLWALFYLCILICLHSTFRRIVLLSETVGSYADLKLIKGFIRTVKDTISEVISTGIKKTGNHKIDEITVLSVSAVVLLAEVFVVISYIVYLAVFWRLIFLSHLIK